MDNLCINISVERDNRRILAISHCQPCRYPLNADIFESLINGIIEDYELMQGATCDKQNNRREV